MNIFNLFSKKEEEQKEVLKNVEMDSKKTSRVGYLFLFLMIIFGVVQGNNLFDSIKSSMDQPQQLSYCFQYVNSRVVNKINSEQSTRYGSYYYDGYYGDDFYQKTCQYSAYESEKNFSGFFTSVSADLERERLLKLDVSGLNSKISNSKYDKDVDVEKAKADLADKMKELEPLTTSIDKRINDYKFTLAEIENAYGKAYDVYEYKQFILMLVLILPIFYFVGKKYFKEKDAASEYAIIWGGVYAIFAILSAEFVIRFIYLIIPKNFIRWVISLMQEFAFLLIAFEWLVTILIPVFFGALIYFIQKKFYNAKAVAIRAIKNGECPQCSSRYEKNMNFCPVCAYQFKSKCTHCGEMRMIGANYCQACGK